MKTITFLNKKGGVGKTSFAFNVAKDLDYFLISNDDSIIESLYPEKAKIMEKIKYISNANIVYDLGGFIDKNSIDILKHSDIVFVPTLLDVNSIKRTINTINEIREFCNEIVILINNFVTKDLDKYSGAINILEKENLDIIFIPKSEAIPNSLYTGKTITEQVNSNKLIARSFKRIFESYNKILEKIGA